ncbi:hypothetical protein RKE29_11200 [Streptomyces sp. B1866]|uniref:hypothetical protein n=1 Tax=Streptomyces sp. B1866 TaxID=3075431 RepID=UPI00288E6ABA|nr:hypothetical protein [Streptomyces sp. B1866]MDT3397206.1 hypothetical protein [Streptomyces sp. B1866]
MPAPAPAVVPPCVQCLGFARAAVTTGARHPDGTRATVRVACPACHGTGATSDLRALIADAATAAFTRH